MNNKITIESLAQWIDAMKEAAKDDTSFSISWFPETVDKPFSIIAGWQKKFMYGGFPDMFCCSKSNPEYVMCIKIAVNEDKNWYCEFDSMDMPVDKDGEVDDTLIMLEWEDSSEAVAEFFIHEWERVMEEHGEEI